MLRFFSVSTALLSVILITACGGSNEAARDGGVQSTNQSDNLDPRNDDRFTEYRGGQFGLFLSAEPEGTYCLIRETTRRGCRGWSAPRKSVRWLCHDNATDCDMFLRPDTEEESRDCFKNVDYQVETFGELYGTCDHFERYDRGDRSVQCLVHEDCPTGRLCTDYQCICPPGADCACLGGVPTSPVHCEGDVLVRMTESESCDENGYSFLIDESIDCAAQGGRCDMNSLTCIGTNTDAGSTEGPGPQSDAGSSSPDAGMSDPDTGSGGPGCECPPTPPPHCDGNTAISDVCEPSDCSIVRQETPCANGCSNGSCN